MANWSFRRHRPLCAAARRIWVDRSTASSRHSHRIARGVIRAVLVLRGAYLLFLSWIFSSPPALVSGLQEGDLFIMHLALGGCLGVPPIRYGITSDTGGHIAYVLGAAVAQADLRRVEKISLVTRLFDEDDLGEQYTRPQERLTDKIQIVRIQSTNRSYLEKEALAADLPAFSTAFCEHLAGVGRLPDVIHAHFADAASVALIARTRFGIPFVYTPHALGLDKRQTAGGNAIINNRIERERDAMAEADAIIVSSENEALSQIAAYGVAAAKTKTSCIPPGAPTRPVMPKHTASTICATKDLADPSKPIILSIARPVFKKNLLAVVRAYRDSAALMDKANLVLIAGQHACGKSSIEERQVLSEIRRLCELPALQGRVAFPPVHGDAEIAALYAKAALGGVFVNPALHEPFGLTLIEAAQAGVPVVATRNGGAADIVAALGHGILIDPLNEDEISLSCLSVISDKMLHKTFSRAARKNLFKYDWRRYAKKSVSLYASLQRGPRLLAADVDNTLTGCLSGSELFARWRAQAQIPLVLATGRSLSGAIDVLAEWHLPEPDVFIVDNGTRVALRAANNKWELCNDYATLLDNGWDRDAVISTLSGLGLDSQPSETCGPHKLSFFGHQAAADEVRLTLEKAGLNARVIFSHGHLIDVIAPRAGKAAALAWVAARYNLGLNDCVAAGDSGNDLDMLAACGGAIAVINGGHELDSLESRPGLIRVTERHANGVMEGLASFGLVPPELGRVAA